MTQTLQNIYTKLVGKRVRNQSGCQFLKRLDIELEA